MNVPQPDLVKATLDLAAASGAVSNFCDHAEHNEVAEIRDVQAAAKTLRDTSVALSLAAGHDPIELYAERLGAIEARNVLHFEGALDSAASTREAADLRSLQLIQAAHDHAYHVDVVGLTKSDQLRHYALHVAKLAGSTADVVEGRVSEEDWLARRVPDMLLFGIKLSTVTAERLPATPLGELTAFRAPLRSAA